MSITAGAISLVAIIKIASLPAHFFDEASSTLTTIWAICSAIGLIALVVCGVYMLFFAQSPKQRAWTWLGLVLNFLSLLVLYSIVFADLGY